MATQQVKANGLRVTFPEGRLINASLFVMDIYKNEAGQEGMPSYKVEMAYDPAQITGEKTVEDDLIDYACDTWGNQAEDWWFDGKIASPFLDGDTLAQRRADKGKAGDAYKGKLVVRANTSFNAEGQKGPGGAYVVGPDNRRITGVESGLVYNGCYGLLIGTLKEYKTNRGEPGLKFYLVGFQKTRDGEKLISSDKSTLFQPIAGAGTDTSVGERRRRRAG